MPKHAPIDVLEPTWISSSSMSRTSLLGAPFNSSLHLQAFPQASLPCLAQHPATHRHSTSSQFAVLPRCDELDGIGQFDSSILEKYVCAREDPSVESAPVPAVSIADACHALVLSSQFTKTSDSFALIVLARAVCGRATRIAARAVKVSHFMVLPKWATEAVYPPPFRSMQLISVPSCSTAVYSLAFQCRAQTILAAATSSFWPFFTLIVELGRP